MENEINEHSRAIRKYCLKDDIVVYRGIDDLVRGQMKEAAKDIDGVDLYDRAFLNTSLVKGC